MNMSSLAMPVVILIRAPLNNYSTPARIVLRQQVQLSCPILTAHQILNSWLNPIKTNNCLHRRDDERAQVELET